MNEKSFYRKASAILVVEVTGQDGVVKSCCSVTRGQIHFKTIKVLKGQFQDKEFKRPFVIGKEFLEGIPNLAKTCEIGLTLTKGKRYIFTPDDINPSMVAQYSEAEVNRIMKLAEGK